MKHHCQQFAHAPMTRRAMLSQCAVGFGGLALAGLMGTPAFGRTVQPSKTAMMGRHLPAKAKSCIFLYMDGGPSHVDTFDYKPALAEHNGKNPYDVMGRVEPTQFDDIGSVLQSPWEFNQYGESGAWVSDLFPHVAECVDDIAFIKSMTSKFPEHTSANYFLHTGHGLQGRPSMGSWMNYGLGSENENLPGFIVLNGGLIPPGGLDNFNSGFLPAAHQGSVFKAGEHLVANIARREQSDAAQRSKLDLVQSLDQALIQQVGGADALESAVANYETAYRMQTAVPRTQRHHRRIGRNQIPLRARPRQRRHAHVWPQLLARAPLSRAGRALCRAHLPRRRGRPMGPARQPARWPRQERAQCRPTDRSPAQRLETPRHVGRHARRMGRRVWAHPPLRRAETAGTTTRLALRCGWRAAASRAARASA